MSTNHAIASLILNQDKAKKLYGITFTIAIFAIIGFLSTISLNPSAYLLATTTTIIIAIILLIHIRNYFKKNLNITLTKEGLSIHPVGHIPWENLFLFTDDTTHYIGIKQKLSDKELKSLPMAGDDILSSYPHINHTIQLNILNNSTNMPVEEFWQMADLYSPNGTFDQTLESHHRTTRSNKTLWNTLSLVQKITISSMTLLSMLAYTPKDTPFVVSHGFSMAVLFSFLIILIVFSVIHVLCRSKQKELNLLYLILSIVTSAKNVLILAAAITYATFVGLGDNLHKISTQTDYSASLYFHDKHAQSKKRDCGWKLKNKILTDNQGAPFCLNQNEYDALTTPGLIKVSGKQSFFGRTIEHYEIVPNKDLPAFNEQTLTPLIADWIDTKTTIKRYLIKYGYVEE